MKFSDGAERDNQTDGQLDDQQHEDDRRRQPDADDEDQREHLADAREDRGVDVSAADRQLRVGDATSARSTS